MVIVALARERAGRCLLETGACRAAEIQSVRIIFAVYVVRGGRGGRLVALFEEYSIKNGVISFFTEFE